jgi:hypothetical protein
MFFVTTGIVGGEGSSLAMLATSLAGMEAFVAKLTASLAKLTASLARSAASFFYSGDLSSRIFAASLANYFFDAFLSAPDEFHVLAPLYELY